MSMYQGTKTEENLRAAFAGESMARNKYTYFSMAARKEGLDEIADHFERLSKNEMVHAQLWFESMYGSPKSTANNLVIAAKGEYDEWHNMYPDFAKQARADGFNELAVMFEHVADIERDHERQFMSLFAKLTYNTAANAAIVTEPVPEQPKTETRNGHRCLFCGAVYEKRPDACNVCHAIGSFEPCKYEVEIK